MSTFSGAKPSPSEQRDAQNRDSFDADLRPNNGAGQNSGVNTAPGDEDLVRAYDVKEVHDLLPEWNSDELKQLVFLRPGFMLQQGASYYDLRNPQLGEFKVNTPTQVQENQLVVSKSELEYTLWNKLTGNGPVTE